RAARRRTARTSRGSGSRRRSWRSGGERAREIAGEVLLVRLERATADLEQLRVPQQALDRELGAVAPAAEDLHGVVGDLLPDRGGEQLRGVGAAAVRPVGPDAPGDVIDQAARRLRLGIRLGNVALDLSVLRNRLAERAALDAVAQHDREAPVGDAEAHC